MKKILKMFLLFINVIWISGCGCSNKVNFSYFKDSVGSIDGYKYYVISEEIYNNNLLLYKNDKSVYFDGNKIRIVLDTKEINEIDVEDLYSVNQEEFYKQENQLYYKENNAWKVKTVEENTEEIGFVLKENMFSNYKINRNSKSFTGSIKNEAMEEFFGFALSNVTDLVLKIDMNKSDKVEKICLEYKESNGNNVVVSINVGYEYISRFELPTLG